MDIWRNSKPYLKRISCMKREVKNPVIQFLKRVRQCSASVAVGRMRLFPTQLHVHQRMNANGNWHQMIYFPKTIIQWDTIHVMDMLHYCCTMHNNTYSVHNRSSKPWWGCLLCPRSSCYAFSPPLSGLNWCSISPFGGPGPPTPKVASPFPGSAHTPSPWSRTETTTDRWAVLLVKTLTR